MNIEKLLENSKLENVNTILSLSIIDSNFGKLYLYFTPWENSHYRATPFFKDYEGYITPLEERTLGYKDFEQLVLNIDTITNKVIDLCEKTKDEFVEEFRVDRPYNDTDRETGGEEFNLIIYSIAVGDNINSSSSCYLDVWSDTKELGLNAFNYNLEELCDVLRDKEQKFRKKLSKIVFDWK